MPISTNGDQERMDRIERLVQQLQKELAEMREEKRVVAEQMHHDAAMLDRRAVVLAASARTANRRASDREVRTSARTSRGKRR